MNKKSDSENNFLSQTEIFKICPSCQLRWTTRDMFLQDPELEIIGYQANFGDLEMGLFLFNHCCGTTLSIWAKDFIDLYHGPLFKKRATGSEECRGLCLDKDDLHSCPVHCECAYVREVVTLIKTWPKLSSSPA